MYVIDEIVKKAAAEGAFDNLEGAGKPIASLHDKRPMVDRFVEQKCAEEDLSLADALPPGLALRRHVPLELARIRRLRSAHEVREALMTLNAHISAVNSRHIHGPHSNMGPVDVTAELMAWASKK